MAWNVPSSTIMDPANTTQPTQPVMPVGSTF